MARRAFLYVGITFLIMASMLILANYMALSQQSKEETQLINLELDVLYSLTSNLNNLLANDKDNVIADALSDATFAAINSTSVGLGLPTICNSLDPTYFSPSQNISKWIFKYINSTLFEINESFWNINIDYTIVLNSKSNPCKGSDNLRSIEYKANISYSLSIPGPPQVQLNQTVLRNKTLEITQIPDTNPQQYGIKVIDETGRLDFNKRIACAGIERLICETIN